MSSSGACVRVRPSVSPGLAALPFCCAGGCGLEYGGHDLGDGSRKSSREAFPWKCAIVQLRFADTAIGVDVMAAHRAVTAGAIFGFAKIQGCAQTASHWVQLFPPENDYAWGRCLCCW